MGTPEDVAWSLIRLALTSESEDRVGRDELVRTLASEPTDLVVGVAATLIHVVSEMVANATEQSTEEVLRFLAHRLAEGEAGFVIRSSLVRVQESTRAGPGT